LSEKPSLSAVEAFVGLSVRINDGSCNVCVRLLEWGPMAMRYRIDAAAFA